MSARDDANAPRMGERGWYPDHAAERRADFERTTPAERVAEAIELSTVVTTLAVAGRRNHPLEEPPAALRIDRLDANVLLRSLVEFDVDFVVIGGLAVAAHGYVRATKDLDIVLQPDNANRQRLVEALKSLDTNPIDHDVRTRAGRIKILASVAGVETYGELRERVFEIDLPTVGRVLFAGYDDLVAMKCASGREADQQDLARLEDARRGCGQSR